MCTYRVFFVGWGNRTIGGCVTSTCCIRCADVGRKASFIILLRTVDGAWTSCCWRSCWRRGGLKRGFCGNMEKRIRWSRRIQRIWLLCCCGSKSDKVLICIWCMTGWIKLCCWYIIWCLRCWLKVCLYRWRSIRQICGSSGSSTVWCPIECRSRTKVDTWGLGGVCWQLKFESNVISIHLYLYSQMSNASGFSFLWTDSNQILSALYLGRSAHLLQNGIWISKFRFNKEGFISMRVFKSSF